ncbi:Spc98 family-domain-containing protein [Cokeromyces recurvatus]|uniref:Spc98 family-domain-containing protein n=1 Tax=Cokeromyces recurvatus TaxID=90255 RepID=UPI00221EED7F|nr:Spc98 family-domain-containing protein [Cokeromyces recurvatus]KAI7906548.1 Spc98 family-domain-containing protein [Cokeromyces recurvatus]
MNTSENSRFQQQQRYNERIRSNHSRLSTYSLQTEESFSTGAMPRNHLIKTLARIVERFDIIPDNAKSQDAENQTRALLDKFNYTILSQPEPSIVENEDDIVNIIHTKLQESSNPQNAFRFGHLYNKLVSRQRLHKRWPILYLLLMLSNIPTRDNMSMNLSPMNSPRTSIRGLENLDQEANDIQPPASRSYEMHSNESPRNIRRRLTREPSPQLTRNLNIDTVPPAVQLARAKEAQRNEHHTMEATIYASESDILRDLIFLFQGIDGQYIRYNAELNDHILIPGLEISKSTEETVLKLAEVGWLYIKIRDFVKQNMHSPTIGLVGQSLCAALQHELTEYYKLIAILEAQIEKQIANKQLPLTDQSLTLKRLAVWTEDYKQKLKLMGILVDVCEDKKGGALISAIHNYTKHGDPFIKTYLIDMLQIISKPFYKMLERWVNEGELDDPYGEFFVACDATVSEEELWQAKYTLRENMLPSFLSKELAHKIFSIGKSLNFIRYSCHDDILTVLSNVTDMSSIHHTFQYGETYQLEKSIDLAYKNTSKALLNLLKTKYKLMDHLKALKQYMLLGQGDFIRYLMDILWDNLNKPANTLFRHNLTGILETAIKSSDAQYDDPTVLNRLDVRLLEIQKDDLGWDVFSLDYHVDAPINTIFSSTAMHQYLQIFNFLWRLRRVEYTLSSAWRQWGKAGRQFKEITEIKTDIHFTQLAIQRMIHFVYQLQHYVLFEVLECSWDKLETFIGNKSIDLDSIIEAHTNYLNEITEKGFLSGLKQKELADRLNGIFDSVLEYKVVLDYLYNYATSESSKMFRSNIAKDADMISKIRRKHQEMEDGFTVQVLQFIDCLNSFHDEDLRSLSTRLDYNGFYSGFNETAAFLS